MKKNKLLFVMLAWLALAEQIHAQNINKPNIQGPSGLKVNSFSGGLYYQRNDLLIPCRSFPLDITFFYNSEATTLDYGYGHGWCMTYSMACFPDSNRAIIRREDGRKDVFIKTGGNYTAPVGIFDSLIQYQPGKYRLRNKSGINYYFDDSVHHRLTSMTDANNNTITITYTGALPTTITDAAGRSVSMTYTNGHLTQINDPNSSPARHIIFINDTLGNPIMVIDPMNDTVKYEYNDLFDITKITDPLSIPFSISYLDCIHVSSISSPLNNHTFSYNPAQRTTADSMMVNGAWQATSYKYDSTGNMIEKMGNCCGYHLQYEYDTANNIKKKTDANGNVWLYEHDAKGNLTKETDPLGATSVYTYEPVYNKVTSSKDKNNNITNYSYDVHGNQLHVYKPLSISEHSTFDVHGSVLTRTDARGFVTHNSYDTYGDRILITFPDSSTNSFSFDNVGNRIGSTDANGHTTMFQYDLLNRQIKTTDALNNITEYVYDRRGDLVTVIDALNHTTVSVYDALRRRTSMTTPAGTSPITYDEHGNMLTHTDNNGNVTNYVYDTRNRLVLQTNAMGSTRTYSYDENGNKLTETDYRGNMTTFTFDALNHITRITDPYMHHTDFIYDANGNRTSVTDANNHTNTFVYDALNRQIKLQRPIGSIQFEYDGNNNKTKQTDANGHITTYAYDMRNRDTTTTDALSHKTKYVYDLQGNTIGVTDRNSFSTNYMYDAVNRKIKTINAMNEKDSLAYDAVGKTTMHKSPNGNITNYIYDNADRLTDVSDLEGVVVHYRYDANSNKLSVRNANNDSITYTYNALNKATNVKDASGHSSIYMYDNNSNVIGITDRNGHTTHYAYDLLNRKIKAVYPMGNKDSLVYDAVNNTIKMVDDNLKITTYQYDANNRMTQETHADASARHYTYDDAGNVMSRMDNNGAVTLYTYDALNRLTLKNYPGTNDDVYSYDFEGNRISANNGNATITYTYDSVYRVTSENMNGKTITYSYNIPSKKRNLTYPGGRGIEEDFDYRMRLDTIRDGVAFLAGYTYDGGNRTLTRSFSNGTLTNYNYINNDQISDLSHMHGTDTIAMFHYDFDLEGNRLFAEKKHNHNLSEKYSYDDDYRLISFKVGDTTLTPSTQTQYNYDGTGNRTSVIKDLTAVTSYTVNTVNAYTAILDTAIHIPAYDANGNTLNDTKHTYQYDYENRLIKVDNGITATYEYDALGRRIKKEIPGDTINYFYDGNRIIEERNNANIVKATYVYGIWIDDIINMRRNGTDYFYHQNSLGSVVAVTNSSGLVVERYEYDAYGKPTIYDGSYVIRAATAIGNTYMFTGREYDAETGNYHYRTRFYQPDWGRFGQWDSIAVCGDLNLFNYVKNSPLNYIDPYGKSPCLIAAGIGFVINCCTSALISWWTGDSFGDCLQDCFCAGLGGAIQTFLTCQFPGIMNACISGAVGSLASTICNFLINSARGKKSTSIPASLFNVALSGVIGCLGGQEDKTKKEELVEQLSAFTTTIYEKIVEKIGG